MTVSSETSKSGPYPGDSINTSFDFDFTVFTKNDVMLKHTDANGVETDLTLDSDYSVALNADQDNDPGGTITYPISGTPLPSTEKVTPYRAITYTQGTDITNGGGFFPEVVEDMADRAVMLSQQLKELIGRTLVAPISDSSAPGEIPTATARANKYLAFDASGDPIASEGQSGVPTTAVAATLLDDNTIAEMLTTLTFSSYFQTLIVAANAAAARSTLGVYGTSEVYTQTQTDLRTQVTKALTSMIHPDASRGWKDLYKQGVYPAFFNQQWGGAPYGGLPDDFTGEVATGSILHNDNSNVGDSAGQTYRAQGFKVSQNTDVSALWLKIYKTGNPTNNLQVFIYSDSSGSPGTLITNGTATAQSGKLHTSNTSGEWVKFTFATAPSLTAGTQYHIVVKSSGAVDASNYWTWRCWTSTPKYPHGYRNTGDATPTWTPASSVVQTFMVEPATTILQSTGLFSEGKLVTYQGSPLNQSGYLRVANDSYINHKRGTVHYAGTGFDASKTLDDIILGIDHDRIRLSINGSGFPVVELWESDGTKHTVTGTTDVTSGNHIISYRYRAENDGSDYLTLYVDGASEGTPVASASIALDEDFAEKGTTYIGGGLPTAPTWTDDEDMSVLPSASGWTFTGTATEANVFVVNGGVLYQNKAGYASTDYGYYEKTTTLNNSTGWAVSTYLKIKNGVNVAGNAACTFRIQDGAKSLDLYFNEYFVELNDGSTIGYVQYNFLRGGAVTVVGKGSDFYLYINGELVFDGTGLLDAATATNKVVFGDNDTSGGENADVEWHYVKYYEGAFLPEAQACEISERCYWSEDKSALLSTLYNSGTIQSVKTLGGLDRNYIRGAIRRIHKRGITSSPSTTSTSYVAAPEMSAFILGGECKANFGSSLYNITGGATFAVAALIDGEQMAERTLSSAAISEASVEIIKKAPMSLHVAEVRYKAGSSTAVLNSVQRAFTVEAS